MLHISDNDDDYALPGAVQGPLYAGAQGVEITASGGDLNGGTGNDIFHIQPSARGVAIRGGAGQDKVDFSAETAAVEIYLRDNEQPDSA